MTSLEPPTHCCRPPANVATDVHMLFNPSPSLLCTCCHECALVCLLSFNPPAPHDLPLLTCLLQLLMAESSVTVGSGGTHIFCLCLCCGGDTL